MTTKKLLRYDIEDILHLANLQRRRPVVRFVVPALGFVAIGTAIGAGIGLMWAPSSGTRLRQEMSERLDQLRHRMKTNRKQDAHVAAAQT